MAENDSTLARARELFAISESGDLIWRVNLGKARKGGRAGTLFKGYLIVGFDGAKFMAHRVVWAMENGSWPNGLIDHKDGLRSRNVGSNLRDADSTVNAHNQHGPRSDNKSGFLGVCWNKQRGKWKAAIAVGGRSKHLGLFSTAELASAAYLAAKRVLHPSAVISASAPTGPEREIKPFRNFTAPRPGSSGLLGVSWNKRKRKWAARFGAGGLAHHVGYFDDKDAAHAAYLVAKLAAQQALTREKS